MKALQQIQTPREVKRVLLWPKLGNHLVQPQPISRIPFHVQNGVEFVDPHTVTHLEASGNYTVIHQMNGRRIMISKTLKSCSALFPTYFLRTHQSYLVNPEQIQTYLRKEHTVRLDNGTILPVSRAGNGVIQKFVKNGR